MTTHRENVTATRRAAALIQHYSRDDAAGIGVVLAELEDNADVYELVVALLHVHREMIPPMLSGTAQHQIAQILAALAEAEHGDDE